MAAQLAHRNIQLAGNMLNLKLVFLQAGYRVYRLLAGADRSGCCLRQLLQQRLGLLRQR